MGLKMRISTARAGGMPRERFFVGAAGAVKL
jgi:hypothetical protein